MPIDPSLSLGVQVPQPQAANPLGILGGYAQTIRTMSEASLLQQTLQAKQGIGHILATSPDLDSGIAAISRSPFAAFVPNILSDLQNYQLAAAHTAQVHQQMNQSAYGKMMHAIIGGLYDPTRVSANIKAAITGSMSGDPQTDRQMTATGNAIMHALFDGMPTDPAKIGPEYQKRAVGMLIASGMPAADAIKAALPELGYLHTGGAIIPTEREPAGFGGSLSATGGAIPLTLPPQVVHGTGPQGQPVTTFGGGAYGAPTMMGPTATQQARLGSMAQYEEHLDNTATNLFGMMQNINEMRQAMHDFKTGGGASAYVKMAQVAQALGMPKQLVDRIGDGNLAAAQEFEKLALANVSGQMHAALPQSSRWAQYEFMEFQKNNPNINMDPRAINRMFDFFGRMYQYAHAQQLALKEFKGKPGADLTNWPTDWLSMSVKKGYDQLLPSRQAYSAIESSHPGAIGYLIMHPNTAATFDKHFGKGAAEKILGEQ